MACCVVFWVPASAGMTGGSAGNDGGAGWNDGGVGWNDEVVGWNDGGAGWNDGGVCGNDVGLPLNLPLGGGGVKRFRDGAGGGNAGAVLDGDGFVVDGQYTAGCGEGLPSSASWCGPVR